MADIRHSIPLAAKPEEVYPLISTAKGLSQWWAEDVVESVHTVDLGFFNRGTIYRLKLEVEQPPVHAEWVCGSGDEWSGTRLTFRLEARGCGSVLRFTHGGWRSDGEYFLSCNTTWGELMFRLKSAAEGKSRGPLFLAGGLAY